MNKSSHLRKMPGMVYWITGYSGAGKTTIATMLASRLRSIGRTLFLLDGDVMRHVLGIEGGFDQESRFSIAMRYARLCKEISEQRIDVVCATISMFDEVRRWNKENIHSYQEIYLRVSLEERRKRDPKGLYSRSAGDPQHGMVGMDIAGEEPRFPNLILDNMNGMSPEKAVDMILANDSVMHQVEMRSKENER